MSPLRLAEVPGTLIQTRFNGRENLTRLRTTLVTQFQVRLSVSVPVIPLWKRNAFSSPEKKKKKKPPAKPVCPQLPHRIRNPVSEQSKAKQQTLHRRFNAPTRQISFRNIKQRIRATESEISGRSEFNAACLIAGRVLIFSSGNSVAVETRRRSLPARGEKRLQVVSQEQICPGDLR